MPCKISIIHSTSTIYKGMHFACCTYLDVTNYFFNITALTLCSPSLTFGTSAPPPPPLPDSTFGTNTVAMHTELNPIVLHLWTQWHCLEHNSVNIRGISMVIYPGELPALSVLLIFQLGYLGVLKNNLAFMGFNTQRAKS